MDGISLTPEQEKLKALKEILPEVCGEKSETFKSGYKTIAEIDNPKINCIYCYKCACLLCCLIKSTIKYNFTVIFKAMPYKND